MITFLHSIVSSIFVYTLAVQILAESFKEKYKNKKEEFIDLLYMLHEEPRTNKESRTKSKLQQAGNIEECSRSEVYFLKVQATKHISDIFKQSKETTSRSFVLLEGAPGIGKTMVAKEIAYQWANKHLLQNIKLLLLVYCRDTNIHNINNSKDLIKCCYEDENKAAECADYFINEVQGENLMIVFDGYDELPACTRLYSFLKDLLISQGSCRTILPKSTIVLTSRSHTISNLYQSCTLRVEVMGLTEEDRDRCLKNSLSDEEYKFAIDYLKKHLIINSLCYIPLNMTNFIHLIKDKDRALPTTQTQLTEKSICLLTSLNKKDKTGKPLDKLSLKDPYIKDDITWLAKFSYQMIEKELLVFTEAEISQAKFKNDGDYNVHGLLQSVELHETIGESPKRLYNFVHFSFQEYLAALYLSSEWNITQYFAMRHKFWDEKYFGIWRMYTGIIEGDSFSLQVILSEEWMLVALIYYFLGELNLSVSLKDNKVRCLQLYLMFLEAPHTQSHIKGSLNHVVSNYKIDLENVELKFNDLNILGYFISKSYITMKWEEINLRKCKIDDNHCRTLCHQLIHTDDGRKMPIIKTLNISNNEITEFVLLASLIEPFKIRKLLAANNLCKICISCKICGNDTLEYLDISNNNLENDDIHNLCTMFTSYYRLEVLNFNGNKNINEEILKPLVTAIIQWHSFKKLKYENTELQKNKKATNLLTFVIKIKAGDLKVKYKGNDVHHFIEVLNCIKDVPTDKTKFSKVDEISLFYGRQNHINTPKLTGEAGYFIAKLKTLSCLYINGVVVTKEAADLIADSLQNNLSINSLYMINCELTSESFEKLSEQLFTVNLKHLQLCENSLDDKIARTLAVAILHMNFFEEMDVDVTKNKFSEQCILLFTLLIAKYQCKTINLDNHLAVETFIEILHYVSASNKQLNYKYFCQNISEVYDLSLQYSPERKIELTVSAAKSLKYFKCLSNLSIEGIYINNESASVLSRVFHENRKKDGSCLLRKLKFNYCNLNTVSVLSMLSNAETFESLKELDLNHNCITDEDKHAYKLIVILLQMPKLCEFKVDKKHNINKIFDIIVMFKNDNPFVVYNYNEKLVAAFLHVLSAMKVYNTKISKSRQYECIKNIKKLDCECHYQKMAIPAASFFMNFKRLESLNISGISMDSETIAILAKALTKSQCKLKTLVMKKCQLNTINLKLPFLSKILPLTARVLELDIRYNKITDCAVEALAASFLTMGTVKVEYNEGNQFSDLSMKILEIILKIQSVDGLMDCSGSSNSVATFISFLHCLKNYATSVTIENIKILNLKCLNLKNPLILNVDAHYSLRTFTNLTEFNMSGVVLEYDAGCIITEVLTKSLKILILHDCQLDSKCVKNVLCQKVCYDKNIEQMHSATKNTLSFYKLMVLDISKNKIESDAVDFLIKSFLFMPELTVINIDENKFSDTDIITLNLCVELKEIKKSFDFEKQLIHIYKQDPSFRIHPAKEINKQNKDNKEVCIKYGNFECCRSKSQPYYSNCATICYGRYEIKRKLIPTHCLIVPFLRLLSFVNDNKASVQFKNISKLTELKSHWTLTKNTFTLPKGRCISLEMFRNLTELNLSGIDLSKTIDRIADTLPSRLHSLTLSNCHLHPESIAKLFNSLPKSSLEELCLSYNKIDTQATIAMKSFFSENEVLTTLDLANCQMYKDKVAVECVRALSTCKQLKQLNINNNNINDIDDIDNELIKSFLVIPNLKVLKVDGNNLSEVTHAVFALSNLKIKPTTAKTDLELQELIENLYKKGFFVIKINNKVKYVKAFLILLTCMKGFLTEHHVEKFIMLKEINISVDKKQNIAMTKKELSFFRTFKCLDKLILNGIHFQLKTIDDLVDTLKYHLKSLKVLQLTHCKLDSKFVTSLLSCEEGIPSALTDLTHLNLSHNIIKDDVVNLLIETLIQMPKLIRLNMSHNLFIKHNMREVFTMIEKWKSPESYQVRYYNLHDINAFIALLTSINNIPSSHIAKHLAKIEYLDLHLDDREQCSLPEASCHIFRTFTVLRCLYINNICIEPQAATVIATVLAKNLTKITLSKCHLHNESVINLVDQLKKEKVKELCLPNNNINYKAANSLKKFITNNEIIEYVNLSKNDFKAKGAIILAEGLRNCRHLRYFDLSSNSIENEAFEPLREAVKRLWDQHKVKEFKLHAINNLLDHNKQRDLENM